MLEYGLALTELDSLCLNILITNMTDPGAKSQSQGILAQFHEVNKGRQKLNAFYLEDVHVINLWNLAVLLLRKEKLDILQSSFSNGVNEFGYRLQRGATKVANALIDAAKKELLSQEREAAILERWTILDALFDELKWLNSPKKTFKLVPTWYVSTLPMVVIATY